MLHPVVEGVHRLAERGANCYLVEGVRGLTLIDTGFPETAPAILTALGKLGRAAGDLKHIVLTHAHYDHIGSLHSVALATGARTWIHAEDAAIAAGEEPFRPLHPPPGLIGKLLYRRFAGANRTVDASTVDETVFDGDEIPAADGLKVVHLPGHCRGQIALVDQARSTAFVGDVAMNVLGLGDPIGFENLAEGRRSQRRLGSLNFNVACFGHGTPLLSGASEAFRRKWG